MRAATPWAAPLLAALLAASCSVPAHGADGAEPASTEVTLESLAIPVTREQNRAVSFTNKRSAYYYTQTHRNDHVEHAWFRGLNIAGRRVFSDYQLLARGAVLDPVTAQVIVRPDALVRDLSQRCDRNAADVRSPGRRPGRRHGSRRRRRWPGTARVWRPRDTGGLLGRCHPLRLHPAARGARRSPGGGTTRRTVPHRRSGLTWRRQRRAGADCGRGRSPAGPSTVPVGGPRQRRSLFLQ